MFTFFLLNKIDLLGFPLLLVMFVLVVTLAILLFFALKNKSDSDKSVQNTTDQESIITSVLEHSGSSGAILDAEGFFRYVNRTFEEMFRPGDRPLTGKNIRDIPRLSRLQQSFGKVNKMVVPFQGDDGVSYMIKYAPVRNANNETTGWFLRMIPDLNEDESEYDLSHELKTPLHAILGFSELMKNDTNLSKDQEKLLNKIIDHSRQLDSQIKRIVGDNLDSDSGSVVTSENNNDTIKNILVVDDVSINRTLLKLMLKRYGFVVREASNGEAALEVLKKWNADLILMDLSMPVMDGLETVKEIRKKQLGDDGPKIIAVTATQRYSLDELRVTGFDDLIQKPFKEEDLLTRLGIEQPK